MDIKAQYNTIILHYWPALLIWSHQWIIFNAFSYRDRIHQPITIHPQNLTLIHPPYIPSHPILFTTHSSLIVDTHFPGGVSMNSSCTQQHHHQHSPHGHLHGRSNSATSCWLLSLTFSRNHRDEPKHCRAKHSDTTTEKTRYLNIYKVDNIIIYRYWWKNIWQHPYMHQRMFTLFFLIHVPTIIISY